MTQFFHASDFSEALTLFSQRLEQLVARSDLAFATRADVAVKILEFDRLASSLSQLTATGKAGDALREHVETASQLIEKVEREDERDYLFQILLDQVLASSCVSDDLLELCDAILARIAREEERQTPLYHYAARLLAVAPFDATTRAKALELAEELDDLVQYEAIVATSRAAELVEAVLARGLDAFIPTLCTQNEAFELETAEGLLTLYDRALVAAARAKLSDAPDLLDGVLQLGAEETLKFLKGVDEILDSKTLEASELDNLANFARLASVTTPKFEALDLFLRDFVACRDAFEIVPCVLRNLNDGDAADAWRALATTLANRSELSDDERLARLLSLFTSDAVASSDAKTRRFTESLYKDIRALMADSRSDAVVFNAYHSIISAFEQSGRFDREAECVREFVDELTRADAELMRDYALKREFSAILRVLDRAEAEELVETSRSPVERAALTAQLRLRYGDSPVETAKRLLQATGELDPVLETQAILETIRFVVEN